MRVQCAVAYTKMEKSILTVYILFQISDLILYYYQGLRMWSRVVLFDEQVAEHYVKTVKQLLLKE